MRAPRFLVVCCVLMSCSKLVGIQDYKGSDAGGLVMGDGGTDGSAPVPFCSVGIGRDPVCSSLAAGIGQTCVIAPDGLYCWGQALPSKSSDVNMPVLVTSSVPTQVESSTSPDGFGATFGTTCYLLGSDLMCWGNTEVAQVMELQKGTPVAPQQMSLGGAPISAFAVGGDHVAVTSGSSGVCWGATSANQCDTGPGVGSANCNNLGTYCDTTPLPLGTNTGKIIVAGAAHTCVSPDGNEGVTCWGDDSFGQLGAFDASIARVQLGSSSVSYLGVASALALGATHACAIADPGGDTYCWGGNSFGELGTGSGTGEPQAFATPVTLPANTHFVAIASGTNTICAIDQATNVWCWGADTQGIAGQAPVQGVFNKVAIPMITNVTDAIAIAVGDEHACAMLDSGAIECWGDNQHGELGDGVSDHMVDGCIGDCSPQPVTVKGP